MYLPGITDAYFLGSYPGAIVPLSQGKRMCAALLGLSRTNPINIIHARLRTYPQNDLRGWIDEPYGVDDLRAFIQWVVALEEEAVEEEYIIDRKDEVVDNEMEDWKLLIDINLLDSQTPHQAAHPNLKNTNASPVFAFRRSISDDESIKTEQDDSAMKRGARMKINVTMKSEEVEIDREVKRCRTRGLRRRERGCC